MGILSRVSETTGPDTNLRRFVTHSCAGWWQAGSSIQGDFFLQWTNCRCLAMPDLPHIFSCRSSCRPAAKAMPAPVRRVNRATTFLPAARRQPSDPRSAASVPSCVEATSAPPRLRRALIPADGDRANEHLRGRRWRIGSYNSTGRHRSRGRWPGPMRCGRTIPTSPYFAAQQAADARHRQFRPSVGSVGSYALVAVNLKLAAVAGVAAAWNWSDL